MSIKRIEGADVAAVKCCYCHIHVTENYGNKMSLYCSIEKVMSGTMILIITYGSNVIQEDWQCLLF